MAIDYTVPCETTFMVKNLKPTFYPQAKIDIQHYQLKHRISTRESDTVYYCSSHEIYALHTQDQRRELVKSLSFEPKCLDAAYGWICAGSKEGRCAFIQITNDQDTQPWSDSRLRNAEVDDLLPLDLDPASRSLMNQVSQYRSSTDSMVSKYELHSQMMGNEIVNSIVIHKMQSVRKGLEDELVVIATNNDKTVRIFSLSQLHPLVVLTYPVSMNHATLSPDGNLLLAVGDRGQAFFHRRVPFENSTVLGDKCYSTCGWIAIAEPMLPRSSSYDACFSTDFSPSGHRCAVGSEGGIITVYDTSLITEEMEQEDAVVCVMKTSRPSIAPDFVGAVRSISFSPSPWDLLVVGEDQGRVAVLDLRDPELMSRQTLELSTDPSDVLMANFPDTQSSLEQRQLEIERRFLDSHREALDAQNYLAAVTNTADHLEYAAERRQIERDMLNNQVQALVDTSQRLTESERRMIDSIGLRRVQVSDISPLSSTTAPISVSHTPSSSSRHTTESPYSPSTSTLLANAAIAGREPQSRSSASIAEYMHQRNIERERQTRMLERQPRRRSSVVISNSSSRNSNGNSNSNNTATLAPVGTATPTISTSPSRLPSSSSTGTPPAPPTNTNDTTPPSRTASSLNIPDPWQTITDAMASTSNNNPPGDALTSLTEAGAIVARPRREASVPANRRSNAEMRPLGTSTATNEARINQQTMQIMLARTELQRTRDRTPARAQYFRQMHAVAVGDIDRGGSQDVQQRRTGGAVVQGVGWSRDGRSLFVATETGLLEYTVNVRERMQWPGFAFS